MRKTWFITGASRGFGALIAEAALGQGDNVVATARDPRAVIGRLGQPADLLALPLDVTSEAQAREAAGSAIARFERIDVLLNNAGFGLLGAVEESSAEEVERVYRTNVFGLLAVTRAVLPHMRRQRRGHVLNMSSVGGYTASAGFGVYGSTKARQCRRSTAAHAVRQRCHSAHRGEERIRGAGTRPLARPRRLNRRHERVTNIYASLLRSSNVLSV
jgi:NAD(P)-dependent dehydrogenase (short-subunit alcohol dehydrogenase family)